MREPTGLASGLADLLRFAVRSGLPRGELVATCAIDERELADPDGRVRVSAYYALLEAVVERSGDPFFALRYLDQVAPDSIGAVGFLAVSSATLGQALERIVRFQRVLSGGDRFEMRRGRSSARFQVSSFGPTRPAHAITAEMYAYDTSALAARLSGAPVRLERLELRHAPRAPAGEYHRRFGVVPRFGAPANRWSIPQRTLAHPMPRADAGLARVLERQVSRVEGTLPRSGSLAEELRLAIGTRLADGRPPLAELARALRLVPRTLQRRLDDEGLSYRELVDEARRAIALASLARGESIAEASFLAGFSQPRALHRAFRRWTGTTPEIFRAAQAPPEAGSSPRAKQPAGSERRAK
jgi:AraC-like DNA-binding protein